MRTLALCAGYGGLELGLQLAGWAPGLVAYAEIDPHASKVMAHRWPDAPNLGDLTQVTDPPAVDLVTAGFPCQPVSTVGAQKGTDDARWLIRDVVAVWESSGAPRLILENVPGLLTANDGEAFGQVLEALAEVGATARWACLRASDVGACHRRERWFAVAHAADNQQCRGERPRSEEETIHSRASGRGRVLADTYDTGDEGHRRAESPRWAGIGADAGSGHHSTADTDSVGLEQFGDGGIRQDGDISRRGDVDRCARAKTWGRFWPAINRWEHTIGRAAPAPLDDRGRLNPVLVEFMMGLPEGWVTGIDLTRSQMLHILGNGVVPQQAAHAVGKLAA